MLPRKNLGDFEAAKRRYTAENADLLRQISDAGSGVYYFVESGESSFSMVHPFVKLADVMRSVLVLLTAIREIATHGFVIKGGRPSIDSVLAMQNFY